MNRPSYKELNNKINDAIRSVKKGDVFIINPEAVASDAIQLGYELETELTEVLCSVLSDTGPEQYVGRRPPSKSYEDKIIESELFPFRTVSKRFGCKIYIKFTMFDEEFFLISLHKNRNKEGRA